MTNKQLQEILRIIEGLSIIEIGSNFYKMATMEEDDLIILDNKEIKCLSEFIDKIYKFSHITGDCENPHPDWRKELNVEKVKLKEMELI